MKKYEVKKEKAAFGRLLWSWENLKNKKVEVSFMKTSTLGSFGASEAPHEFCKSKTSILSRSCRDFS